MNKQQIGILDSGVGGLSIWQEIVKQLPHESTIYIADSKNCPYGTRSTEQIYRLAKQLAQFLLKRQVKLVVIACNTVAVTCLSKLRHDFPDIPIIGAVPVIKTARAKTKTKKIAILSTSTTANSLYQKNLIDQFAKDAEVKSIGLDILVRFVEKGEIGGERLQVILKKTLSPLVRNGFDVIVLGCSHFPFLKNEIQKTVGKNVLLLDSGGAIARQVGRVLTRNKALSKVKAKHSFFTTGDANAFGITATKLIGGTIAENAQHVRL